MTKRAVTYARVSSNDKLKTGGKNLVEQTRLCREYALQCGYHVVADLAEDDRGASGADFDLPQLSKALEMARDGRFDVFVVREVDRLARDITKQFIIERELKRAGVIIDYALYDFPNTPEGTLQRTIYAAFAEFEREKISQRMVRGKLRRARSGNVMTNGRPPFGYKEGMENGLQTLEIAEEEAKIVRMIFEWYTVGDGDNGPMSIRGIASQLSELRIPTCLDLRPQVHGFKKTVRERGQWGCSSVSAILTNETYAGVWHYGKNRDNPIAIEVPAIVDRNIWETVQERKKYNSAFSQRNTKYEYLLARRLYCQECGRKAHGRRKAGDLHYYYCGARRFNLPCTARGSIRVDRADAAAWGWVKELLTDILGLEKSLRKYQKQQMEMNRPLRERLEVVDELLQENQEHLDRLLDLYLSEEFPRKLLTERKVRIETTITELQEEQVRLNALIQEKEISDERIKSIIEFAHTIGEEVEEAEEDFQTRRELLEVLNVTGEMATEDGRKVLYLHCMIGDTKLVIASKKTHLGGSPSFH